VVFPSLELGSTRLSRLVEGLYGLVALRWIRPFLSQQEMMVQFVCGT
jgi:hypothetical protein